MAWSLNNDTGSRGRRKTVCKKSSEALVTSSAGKRISAGGEAKYALQNSVTITGCPHPPLLILNRVQTRK